MEFKVSYRKYVVSVLDDKGIKTELNSCAGAGDDEPVAIHVVRIIVGEIRRRDDAGRCCVRFVAHIRGMLCGGSGLIRWGERDFCRFFNGFRYPKKLLGAQCSLINHRVFNGDSPSTNSQVQNQEGYQQQLHFVKFSEARYVSDCRRTECRRQLYSCSSCYWRQRAVCHRLGKIAVFSRYLLSFHLAGPSVNQI
jgi:hypothetical protein